MPFGEGMESLFVLNSVENVLQFYMPPSTPLVIYNQNHPLGDLAFTPASKFGVSGGRVLCLSPLSTDAPTDNTSAHRT